MADLNEPTAENVIEGMPGVIPAPQGVDEVRELRRLLDEGNMVEFSEKMDEIVKRAKKELYLSILEGR